MVQSCPGPRRRLVSHPSPMWRRIARHDQVVPRPEEHVAARDHDAAVLGGGEIDLPAPAQAGPVGDDVAVGAQASDAAVGKNPQAKVRGFWRPFDRKQVVRVAGQRRARQHLAPVGALDVVVRRQRGKIADVDGARFREVALEVRRVHVDATDHAWNAKPDDRTNRSPARAGGASPSRPSICRVRCIRLPATRGASGAISRSLGAKNSSLAATTAPPRRSAARSISSRNAGVIRDVRAQQDPARAGSAMPMPFEPHDPVAVLPDEPPSRNVIRTIPRSGSPAYGVSL